MYVALGFRASGFVPHAMAPSMGESWNRNFWKGVASNKLALLGIILIVIPIHYHYINQNCHFIFHVLFHLILHCR